MPPIYSLHNIFPSSLLRTSKFGGEGSGISAGFPCGCGVVHQTAVDFSHGSGSKYLHSFSDQFLETRR